MFMKFLSLGFMVKTKNHIVMIKLFDGIYLLIILCTTVLWKRIAIREKARLTFLSGLKSFVVEIVKKLTLGMFVCASLIT